jgi:hypothetical protein
MDTPPRNIDSQIEAGHSDQAHHHHKSDRIERGGMGTYHAGRHEKTTDHSGDGKTDALNEMSHPADCSTLLDRCSDFISHGRLRSLRVRILNSNSDIKLEFREGIGWIPEV